MNRIIEKYKKKLHDTLLSRSIDLSEVNKILALFDDTVKKIIAKVFYLLLTDEEKKYFEQTKNYDIEKFIQLYPDAKERLFTDKAKLLFENDLKDYVKTLTEKIK